MIISSLLKCSNEEINTLYNFFLKVILFIKILLENMKCHVIDWIAVPYRHLYLGILSVSIFILGHHSLPAFQMINNLSYDLTRAIIYNYISLITLSVNVWKPL